MRKLLKTGLLAVMILLVAGCSATRKRKSTDRSSAPADAAVSAIINGVTINNITDRGFVIRKGRIELEGTELDGSFGFNARLNSKGDFLASVKGPLGIELARMISVGSDIAVIDRINRVVYLGKKDEVMQKNGLPGDFLKILFGDIPDITGLNYQTEGVGELTFNTVEEGFKREIRICTDELKVCSEQIKSPDSAHEVLIEFSNFRKSDEYKYASVILMREKLKMLKVRLSIDEFTGGYDTEIAFSLPSYKRSKL